MPYDEIGPAVATGELDAGIMIHEELLFYPQLGLQRIADLGALWCAQNQLPLPVGLNVVRRDLGRETMEQLATAIRASLAHGLLHRRATLDQVGHLGRGAEGKCTDLFVSMFANEDSLRMPADVRMALPVLFRQTACLGLAARVPPLDIVEGEYPGTVGHELQVA
jgi:1,4-dihydroxy-6-naphthoate synthase